MKSYDFYSTFEAMEFQDFARDIIQAREDIVIESFSEGKDKGIDGRCVGADGYTIILQAKKMVNTNERIINVIQKEKKKLDGLVEQGIRVDRYILVLTGDLSVDKKIKVQEMFSPYILEAKDIVGGKDLNNYLSNFKDIYGHVEEKYYKLWLQNTDTLKRTLHEIVNPKLVELSEIHFNDAVKKSSSFVETEVYNEAINKVQRNKVLIISGEPGVGKTTLANQIALFYLTKHKFDHYIYASSMNDLYIAKGIKGKKIIIFDDFWGGNGFDFFGNGIKIKELITFIEYIQKKSDCLLIMTAREYVLEQGLEKNADFRRLVEVNKLDCHIENYSKVDRLKIYYGHLKSTSLTWDQVNELRRIEQIVIDSPNYNPRVIEMFTKSITPDMEAEVCAEKFLAYLNCPTDFWKQIFGELSQEAKVVYLLMAIMPLPVEANILKQCYSNTVKDNQKELEWKGFSEIIIELERTVIRIDLYNDAMAITYQNPSVKDFVLKLLRENFESYNDILQRSCIYYSQCVEYLKFLRELPVSKVLYGDVMKKAIGLIRSESILFYDKHMSGFVSHRYYEISKYYERYSTDSDCSERGFGRYFQIMLLYKNVDDEELQKWFMKKFEDITMVIDRYPESVLWEDLQTYPEVAKHLEEEGVCNDFKRAIEVHMDSVMRNREEIDVDFFRHSYKEGWTEYLDLNREKVGHYLERYYDAEFCLAAATKDSEEFYYLENSSEEIFQECSIEMPESLCAKIRQYGSWLEEEDGEVADKEDEIQKGNIQDIEVTMLDFEENFLNTIMPTEIDDLDIWLDMKMVSNETKSILESAWDRDDKFWSLFFYDEETLEFLIKFLHYQGHLAKTTSEAIDDVVNYMMNECKLSGEELFELLNSISLIDEDIDIFSDEELKDICPNGYAWNADIIEKMLESRMLVNRHNWYRVTNLVLTFSAYIYCVRQLTEKERECYYRAIFDMVGCHDDNGGDDKEEIALKEKLIEIALKWKEDEESGKLLWQVLYELDEILFEKYILAPAARETYDEFAGATRVEKFNTFVDEFEMLVGLTEDGEQFWGIRHKYKYFIITDDLVASPLQKLRSTIFTEKQKEILRRNGHLHQDIVVISLEELRKRELLKVLEIDEKLEAMWDDMCELKEKKYGE